MIIGARPALSGGFAPERGPVPTGIVTTARADGLAR